MKIEVLSDHGRLEVVSQLAEELHTSLLDLREARQAGRHTKEHLAYSFVSHAAVADAIVEAGGPIVVASSYDRTERTYELVAASATIVRTFPFEETLTRLGPKLLLAFGSAQGLLSEIDAAGAQDLAIAYGGWIETEILEGMRISDVLEKAAETLHFVGFESSEG